MATKKISVDVLGMTCAACSTRVEKALNKQEGVKASVNLLANKATIEFDENKVKEEDLIKIIEKTGYNVPLERRNLMVEGMT